MKKYRTVLEFDSIHFKFATKNIEYLWKRIYWESLSCFSLNFNWTHNKLEMDDWNVGHFISCLKKRLESHKKCWTVNCKFGVATQTNVKASNKCWTTGRKIVQNTSFINVLMAFKAWFRTFCDVLFDVVID